ncbi:MAG: 50S ribosomal protein L6 [Bordetella sp.]|nr:MAG: 50S ribosomal protein L6 [Bordetella sp.]
MPRSIKYSIQLPKSVQADIKENLVLIKGNLGSTQFLIEKKNNIVLCMEENNLTIRSCEKTGRVNPMLSTTYALISNMITGVTRGFEKKLSLVGVGFRVLKEKDVIKFQLGFSHDIQYKIPEDISIECPSQTDIIIRGSNKELVGQIAAEIRSYRPPEPYKGKGVRYLNERILIKETKKKR